MNCSVNKVQSSDVATSSDDNGPVQAFSALEYWQGRLPLMNLSRRLFPNVDPSSLLRVIEKTAEFASICIAPPSLLSLLLGGEEEVAVAVPEYARAAPGVVLQWAPLPGATPTPWSPTQAYLAPGLPGSKLLYVRFSDFDFGSQVLYMRTTRQSATDALASCGPRGVQSHVCFSCAFGSLCPWGQTPMWACEFLAHHGACPGCKFLHLEVSVEGNLWTTPASRRPECKGWFLSFGVAALPPHELAPLLVRIRAEKQKAADAAMERRAKQHRTEN